MIKLKLYFNIFILLLISGCNLPVVPDLNQNNIESVFADYDQINSQLFISVNLGHNLELVGDTLMGNLEYRYSPQYYMACIDSIEISNYLGDILNSSKGLCVSPFQPVKGCTDLEAVNFNEFAISDDGSCIYDIDTNWNRIQFGTFDWQNHSVDIIINHTHPIQNFSFGILGLPIDSISNYYDFTYPISLNENKIIWQNYSSESLASGTQKLTKIYFKSPPQDSNSNNFILSDRGDSGDLIAGNSIFNTLLEVNDFIPGIYTLNLPEIFFDGIAYESENLYLFENFRPQIYSVEIPDTFHLDNDFTTYLSINVDVYEPNGFNDIKQVKFMVNTSELTNDDSPDFSEDIFQSDPSWLFQYVSTSGSNIFSYQTNIPMNAANNGGKTGKAQFRFLVLDMSNTFNSNYNISEFEVEIEIIKCGDLICNDGYENVSSCPVDCADE